MEDGGSRRTGKQEEQPELTQGRLDRGKPQDRWREDRRVEEWKAGEGATAVLLSLPPSLPASLFLLLHSPVLRLLPVVLVPVFCVFFDPNLPLLVLLPSVLLLALT